MEKKTRRFKYYISATIIVEAEIEVPADVEDYKDWIYDHASEGDIDWDTESIDDIECISDGSFEEVD
ncbi:hypothetical protein [Faecalibaculum rodentium]|uniref:hypothetical protein n=1 Tax=Faecalibaculum rodentium TaxID=1702221 RepID=UPI0027307B1E|nr:hypothetical protein [Faecalibaculum rodentium]